MKILCIDYGTKNVGTAISDDDGTIAFPLETIARAKAIERIIELIHEKKVNKVVLGLPMLQSGSEGTNAHETRNFAKQLERVTGLIPEYIDETLTTFDAEHEMKQHKVKRSKRKAIIDQLAAQRILQEFLDRQPKKPRP